MSELERRANKRFKILEDYDKRKKDLEQDAVRMLLREAADSNLPIIPVVQSARVRAHCYECGDAYWGLRMSQQCPSCEEAQRIDWEVSRAVGKVQREVRMAVAQEKLRLIAEAQENGVALSEIPGLLDNDRADLSF